MVRTRLCMLTIACGAIITTQRAVSQERPPIGALDKKIGFQQTLAAPEATPKFQWVVYYIINPGGEPLAGTPFPEGEYDQAKKYADGLMERPASYYKAWPVRERIGSTFITSPLPEAPADVPPVSHSKLPSAQPKITMPEVEWVDFNKVYNPPKPASPQDNANNRPSKYVNTVWRQRYLSGVDQVEYVLIFLKDGTFIQKRGQSDARTRRWAEEETAARELYESGKWKEREDGCVVIEGQDVAQRYPAHTYRPTISGDTLELYSGAVFRLLPENLASQYRP